MKVRELPNPPREGRPRRPDASPQVEAQVCRSRSRTGCHQAQLQGGLRRPQLFRCEIGLALNSSVRTADETAVSPAAEVA